jgi:hypothetical protein
VIGVDSRAVAQAKAAARLVTRQPLDPAALRVLAAINDRQPSCSMHAQMQRMLDALAELGSITTAEAERWLGMRNAGQVVLELRRAGILLHSSSVHYLDEFGNVRRTAEYTLSDETAAGRA